MNRAEAEAIYNNLVGLCPEIERKGKSMPYTSDNGHMFSLLNKDNEIGIRFSKETQQRYIEEWDSTLFKSHGATMQGYVKVPDSMLGDLKKLAEFLKEAQAYVKSLPPK